MENEIKLSEIYPNPDQPRKHFDPAKLEELAHSIKQHGLMEPLVLVKRPRKEGKFMIIAGERRWRACQIAGLNTAPSRIIQADDKQIAEMALVENLQREDLTPLEEAQAFQNMLNAGWTKEELADKLGFKQAWRIDERTSLLNLSGKFQDALNFGVLSPSQAFEMSRVDKPDQETIFAKIKAGELNTYNKLRQFVNALVKARTQTALFETPKEKDLEIIHRYEKTLEAVLSLISRSFSSDDCRVLARVYQGNTHKNIERLDLIIKHLDMMKKAMLESQSKQEVIKMTEVRLCNRQATL